MMLAWEPGAGSAAGDDDGLPVKLKGGAQGRSFGAYNGLPEVELNGDKWFRESARDRDYGRDWRDKDSRERGVYPDRGSAPSLYAREAERGRDRDRSRERAHASAPQGPHDENGGAGGDGGGGWRRDDARSNIAQLFSREGQAPGEEAGGSGAIALQGLQGLVGEIAGAGGGGVAQGQGGALGQASPQGSVQGQGSAQVAVGSGLGAGALANEGAGALANEGAGGQIVMKVPIKMMIFVDGTWLYYSLFSRGRMRCPIIKQYGMGWAQAYRCNIYIIYDILYICYIYIYIIYIYYIYIYIYII